MKNRIGIVGGGQLGRMLVFEAKKLGFTVTILDPTPQSPAGQVADHQIVASLSDGVAIEQLAKASDYITYEIEHIDIHALKKLEQTGMLINPSSGTLEIIKDKFHQKQFLQNLHIPTAEFLSVDPGEDVGHKLGYPYVLKSRTGGYDGRGNAVIHNSDDVKEAQLSLKSTALYAEKHIAFDAELAVIVAKDMKGVIAVYPVVETIHVHNICHKVIAPARVSPALLKQAKDLSQEVAQHLKGAGVYAIEMFLQDNLLYINEIAPRVHNSGHLTIEACITNQFEQHIRAITGLPLGKTDMIVPASVMINILGTKKAPVAIDGIDKALGIPQVSVHIYGKTQVRDNRKMGHITAIAQDIDTALQNAQQARDYLQFI